MAEIRADVSTDVTAALEAPARRRLRIWLAIAAAGVLARFALSFCSYGTNDASAFYAFGLIVKQAGLLALYRHETEFNFPPLPGYWAYYTAILGHRHWFTFDFKLPVIVADSFSVLLIYRIWRWRAAVRYRSGLAPSGRWVVMAGAAAAGYAWTLNSILVSGFHCNIDPIYAMFCLLSADLLERKRLPFWAGAALGAAVNIKLVPILVIPPLLALAWRRGELRKFFAGLATGVIPFIPVLLLEPHGFFLRVLTYNSAIDTWGIQCLLKLLGYVPGWEARATDLSHAFFYYGRWVVLAMSLLWACAVRWGKERDAYTVVAVTFSLFLVFTHGFGVQYTAIVTPALFAVRPRVGAVYGAFSGIFLLLVYYIFWDGTFPFFSYHDMKAPIGPAMFGLAAWIALVYFLVTTLLPRRSPGRPVMVTAAIEIDRTSPPPRTMPQC